MEQYVPKEAMLQTSLIFTFCMTEVHSTYVLKNISFFVEFLVILIPVGGARGWGKGVGQGNSCNNGTVCAYKGNITEIYNLHNMTCFKE